MDHIDLGRSKDYIEPVDLGRSKAYIEPAAVKINNISLIEQKSISQPTASLQQTNKPTTSKPSAMEVAKKIAGIGLFGLGTASVIAMD